jgi:putative endonuclease
MYYTYILKSEKDYKRYIGYTSDVAKRLEIHNSGLTPSTRNRRPFQLLCCKKFQSKIDAIKYERYLKNLKGGKQLDIEIRNMLDSADLAQLVEQLHGKE